MGGDPARDRGPDRRSERWGSQATPLPLVGTGEGAAAAHRRPRAGLSALVLAAVSQAWLRLSLGSRADRSAQWALWLGRSHAHPAAPVA